MPNQNIRESKKVLKELQEVFGKILKPYTVYRCVCCDFTQEDQGEVIAHLLEKHTIHEIYSILQFDTDMRGLQNVD